MTTNEARELCQILASLNYDGQQTLVSPELFFKPNFILVSDILRWFARIIDDTYSVKELGDDLNEVSEANIISFLVDIGRLIMYNLGIRVNLVSLYRADLTSCAELLKVAKPIYKAAMIVVAEGKSKSSNIENKLEEILQSGQEKMDKTLSYINENSLKDLSLKLVQSANDLESLLNEEENFNLERTKVIDRSLELPEIERILKDAHEGIVIKTNELAKTNEELEKDLTRLDEKLRAKEFEFEEMKEKLNDLLIQSPTYMEEYEKLNEDYESAYEKYVSKYRNLQYLKSCVYSNSESSSSSGEDEEEEDADYDHQLELAKPVGSTGSLALSSLAGPDRGPTLGSEEEFGRAAAGGAADITGPARLLESLLDGGSNPRSASLTVEALGGGVDVDLLGAEGTGRSLETGGAGGTGGAGAGLRTYVGRADGATMSGLELEGLLNEFVEDESRAGADSGGRTDGALSTGESTDGDEDENENDEDDNDDDDEEGDDEDEEMDGDLSGTYGG